MDPDVKRLLETLQLQGMVFGACGNTMKNFSITLGELPEGSTPLPQGGVVRIMELQEAGYVYIRP
jgi:intracellular sulfur oxidation DsrE/DsrF family protein